MQIGFYQAKDGTCLFLNGQEDSRGFIGEVYNGNIYLSPKEIDELKPIFATHGSPQVSNPRAWISVTPKEANWLEAKLNIYLAQSQP